MFFAQTTNQSASRPWPHFGLIKGYNILSFFFVKMARTLGTLIESARLQGWTLSIWLDSLCGCILIVVRVNIGERM